MRDKEKRRPLARHRKLVPSPPAVIERGDHRLPGSRGRHDQVPVATLHRALGIEPVENLLLKRPRTEFERKGSGPDHSADRSSSSAASAEDARPGGNARIPVLPVRLECRDDTAPQMRRLILAQLDRPLQPLGQRQGAIGWPSRYRRSRIRTSDGTGKPWHVNACGACRTRLAPRYWATIR